MVCNKLMLKLMFLALSMVTQSQGATLLKECGTRGARSPSFSHPNVADLVDRVLGPEVLLESMQGRVARDPNLAAYGVKAQGRLLQGKGFPESVILVQKQERKTVVVAGLDFWASERLLIHRVRAGQNGHVVRRSISALRVHLDFMPEVAESYSAQVAGELARFALQPFTSPTGTDSTIVRISVQELELVVKGYGLREIRDKMQTQRGQRLSLSYEEILAFVQNSQLFTAVSALGFNILESVNVDEWNGPFSPTQITLNVLNSPLKNDADVMVNL